MFYICEDLLKLLHIRENIEIEDNDFLTQSYYNIMEKRENWEWDLIALFKNYDFYIREPPRVFPVCICPLCATTEEHEKISNTLNLKRTIYIMEFMSTICDSLVEDQTVSFINSPEGKQIKKRIEEYYDFVEKMERGPVNTMWGRKDKMFQKIFGLPRILYKIGIPLENYRLRKYYYFDDLIAGNPMASNGWAKDGLDDMMEGGLFG